MLPEWAADTLKAHGIMGVLVLVSWMISLYFYRRIEKLRDERDALQVAHAAKIVEMHTARAEEIAALREECHEETTGLYATLVESHKTRSEQRGNLVEQISELVKNLQGTYIRRQR